MRDSKPPALALWLLDRLAVGEHHESMIGDLIEKHHTSRSDVWFWRQTFGLVAGNLAAAFWTYRWTTVTVVAISTLLPELYRLLVFQWVMAIDRTWQVPLLNWLLDSELIVVWRAAYGLTTGLTSQLVWCVLIFSFACIVGRLRPDARVVVAIVLVVSELAQCTAGLSHTMSGWLRHPTDWVGLLIAFRFGAFALVAIPASVLLGGRAASWQVAHLSED